MNTYIIQGWTINARWIVNETYDVEQVTHRIRVQDEWHREKWARINKTRQGIHHRSRQVLLYIREITFVVIWSFIKKKKRKISISFRNMNYQFFSFLKLAFESFSTLGRSYSCRPVWHQLGLQLKIFLTLSLNPRIIKCCGNCHHRLSDAKNISFIMAGE